MNKVFKRIKSIKIGRVLAVFLAGFILILNTACSQDTVASSARETGTKTVQEFQGGMNGYNDDVRYDAGTAAKAKRLVDTAESQQKDNLGDYTESIIDRAGNKIEQAKRDIP